jgi:penicillin-binding protein 1A
MKKPVNIIVKVTLAAVLLPVLFTIALFLGLFGHLQSRDELRAFRNAEASLVLSSEGDLIGKYFLQDRTNTTIGQLPDHLINALTATEDARFFEHKGIDTRSLFRVLVKSVILNNRRSGGGSTISQQLAKNMYGRKDYGPLSLAVNKSREAILAYRLESTFDKEEILELYLNTVPYGENIYGIETAARKFFNKSTHLLTVEESAVLVGMLKANTFYNPRLNPANALNRRNIVIRQMERYGHLSAAEADSLCTLPLLLDDEDPDEGGPADYFLSVVRRETEMILSGKSDHGGKHWNTETDGLIITTTLDLALQEMALGAFRDHLKIMQQKLEDQYRSPSGTKTINDVTAAELKRMNLEGRSKERVRQQLFTWNGYISDTVSVSDSLKNTLMLLQAGLIAVEPQTGAVRAWVGGIDYRTQPYDQILAKRQMASLFKPVIYATAFEEGFKPCNYLDNDSITLSEYENWSPENYDHSFGGRYSVAAALAYSLNIPTLSLWLSLDFSKIDSLWRRMGFTFPLENNPSLALGTAEASISEAAMAYSAFANGGYRITPQVIASITAPDGTLIYENSLPAGSMRILTDRSALLINAILQKAAGEGTGASVKSVYGVTAPLAAKTGTSQNYADAWFAAYNPRLTLVARVGASIQTVHFNNGANGSGSALALPLVALTLRQIQYDPVMSRKYIVPFPPLPPELEGALDCPDFKDKSMLKRFFDIFRKAESLNTTEQPDTLRKPFFRRIFKK